MPTSREERNRILALVENGQISTVEAAQLLDTLEIEIERPIEQIRERTFRIRITNTHSKSQKVNTIISLSTNLLKSSLRLGANLLPQLNHSTLQEMVKALERGTTGRLLDLQDLEQGERLEIFID